MNSGSGAVTCCAKPTTEADNNTKEINNFFILLILYVIFLMQRYKKNIIYTNIYIFIWQYKQLFISLQHKISI